MIGGSDQYLIDLSYRVYPQFTSKVEKMELWKKEKPLIGNKVFPIKVSNDVVFIRIIDEFNYPYITISLTNITFDMT
jgi:hypothetical protein